MTRPDAGLTHSPPGGVASLALTVQLEERTEVDVLIPTAAPAGDDPTGWEAMREFIGLAGETAGCRNASEDHAAIIYRR